jgi:hemerythrin
MRMQRASRERIKMPLIHWNTEYSVEVDSIDKQHQKLFDMLNGLHDAMKVGKGSQTVPLILGKLVEYTGEHFAKEESLMLLARYPDYARHKAEHDKLTKEVSQMVRDFEQGKIALTIDLQDFLRQWLQTHIVSSDKKYTAHLQAAGIC